MSIYLDKKTSIASSTPKPKPKITIKSDKLKTDLRIHGYSVALIPLVGLGIAIVIAFYLGIGLLEVGLLLGMCFLAMVGVTVGFHRYFTHCTFETSTTMRIILAIVGSMACSGPLIYWVSSHRRHHQYSDRLGDPHSPYFDDDQPLSGFQRFWHSHIGWTLEHEITNSFIFAKDVLRDPIICKINQLYYFWILLGLAIPAVLGGVYSGSWMGALSGVLWGGFIRIFLSTQFTFCINSITHLYGSRAFNTSEQSRNNIWLAIPTGGEAWHNNHHAFPNSAKFGLKWWQIDLGYWTIRTFELAGLVWDVKVPTTGMIEAKSISRS